MDRQWPSSSSSLSSARTPRASGSGGTAATASGGGGVSLTSYSRGGGGGSGSAGRPVPAAFSRPPILLEFSSSLIRAGYVGDAKPKHLIPYNTTASLSSSSSTSNQQQQHWYSILYPVLQTVFYRLGHNTANIASSSSERRVIVLVQEAAGPGPEYVNAAWKEAMTHILLYEFHIPAVSFQCSVCTAPLVAAFPTTTTTNSISANPTATALLLIYRSTREVSCMVHAAGQCLPFTFQSVSMVSAALVDTNNANTLPPPPLGLSSDHADSKAAATARLDQDIVIAILKTIEACPRQLRKEAISNVFFCGEEVGGNLSASEDQLQPNEPPQLQQDWKFRITLQLYHTLKSAPSSSNSGSRSSRRGKSKEQQQQHEEDDTQDVVATEESLAAATKENQPPAIFLRSTVVPVPLSQLSCLADSIGIYSTVPSYRPDLCSWVGASLWAASLWNHHHITTSNNNNNSNNNSIVANAMATTTTSTRSLVDIDADALFAWKFSSMNHASAAAAALLRKSGSSLSLSRQPSLVDSISSL